MAFWRTYYHIIWPTKQRAPLITAAIEMRLYPYIVERAAEMELQVYALNGWSDHIHLAVGIPPKHAVATVVKHLKGASSHYINHELEATGRFAWARGYGVLSFGERQLATVEAYIQNQKRHHAEQTTNRWLEHTAENDEAGSAAVLGSLHEQQGIYKPWGENLI